MIVEALRPSQVDAGMTQEVDPRKHVTVRMGRDDRGREVALPANTTLPPPDGAEEEWVCMVKEGAPHANYSFLGVDFVTTRFENVWVGAGQPPIQRSIYHTHRLTPNQVEALRLKIESETDSGFTGRIERKLVNGELVSLQESVENVPMKTLVKFFPFRGSDPGPELATLEAENARLRKELEEVRAAKLAVPAPKGR